MTILETPFGPRHYLTHKPGPLGWSRLETIQHCLRKAKLLYAGEHAAQEGGEPEDPGNEKHRALFVGGLIHEAIAALFKRLQLVQLGNHPEDWVDPWTFLTTLAFHHAGTYRSRWVDAAMQGFCSLAGLPADGHASDLPWPDAWQSLPDMRFLHYWNGKGGRYRVLLVEETASWQLHPKMPEYTYQPRLDLVLEDIWEKELIFIDWKTTSRWHESHYPEPMLNWGRREIANQKKGYAINSQFQAMFHLEEFPNLPRRVILGLLYNPLDRGAIYDPIEIPRPPPEQKEALRYQLYTAIRAYQMLNFSDMPPPLFQQHRCVTVFGPCACYKQCYPIATPSSS